MPDTEPATISPTHDDPDCACCNWCLSMWAYCLPEGCEHTGKD